MVSYENFSSSSLVLRSKFAESIVRLGGDTMLM